jgi:hypothetical protein
MVAHNEPHHATRRSLAAVVRRQPPSFAPWPCPLPLRSCLAGRASYPQFVPFSLAKAPVVMRTQSLEHLHHE